MKLAIKAIAALAMTSAVLTGTSIASAAEANLRFAHFMPKNSWQSREMFDAWAEAVKEQSGGKLNVTVYPAQTLGKAPAGYDNAKTGIADIAWTVQGYTAGRFPLSQIMELPGLFKTGAVGSCAFQKLYDSGALADEYKETKVLYVHTHSPGHLHTKNQVVTKLSDMKGLKIRRPTDVIGGLLSELGAEPVGMPAPRIYESVQRGTIDGYMLPWSAVNSFRAYEVSKQHTDFGFYALAFVTTMNKAKYDSLSDELKKVIDDNSGMKWSVIAGSGYDKADEVGLAKIKAEGGQINEIDPADRANWEAAAAEVTKDYLAKLDGMGLPGTQTYEKVKGYVSECSSELK